MLDLHAGSVTGAATYTAINLILAGNDGASLIGTPVSDNANLFGWGGLTTIASPILAMKMQSQDQMDTANTQEWITTAGVEGIKHVWDNLPSKAQRTISMKTGAVPTMAYFLDNYVGGNVIQLPKYGKAGKNGQYSQVFGGALTAITWGTVPFAPTTAMPPGKYAILGAKVSSLTNYGLVRFQHKDFGGLFPGFPVMDQTKASARAVVGSDDIFQQDGYQFRIISDIMGVPCCPTFTVTAQGTGLIVWAAAITADTPMVTLNVAQVG